MTAARHASCWCFTVCVIGAVNAGCQPATVPAEHVPAGRSAPAAGSHRATEHVPYAASAPDASGSPPAATVSVEIKSWVQIQEWIAAQRGKVVVVDVWSTYCVPCMREFPQLVALHRRHADQVACLSVAADYFGDPNEPPESCRAKVFSFLEQQQATFPNTICSDPDEQLFKQLDAVAVPIVLVYDRAGVLRKRFTHDESAYGPEGFTYAQHVTPLVEELLK